MTIKHTGPAALSPAAVEGAEWFKSSFSDGAGGHCVEVAMAAGVVGLRDTKDRSRAPHVFPGAAWQALLDGVRSGEFDLPGGGA